MLTALDKSKPSRPTFMAPTEKTAPYLPDVAPAVKKKVDKAQLMAQVTVIQRHLRDVRSGKVRFDRDVIDRITTDKETTFYHLTDEARATLREGGGLPWGA